MNALKSPRGSTVLGLTLDGSRLEGAVLRRRNGSAEILQTLSVALALDPATDDPELVGREIRKHLEAAGMRERSCVMGLPLGWALTLQVKVPELPEADRESYLQIEAERGFPCSLETLVLASSYFAAPGGGGYATLVAVRRSHVTRLEQVLRAAQLRPRSFSLGIVALPADNGSPDEGTLALVPGESSVGLLLEFGQGIAALRLVEGAGAGEGGTPSSAAEQSLRDVRITLGQLPGELRSRVKRVRVYGRGEAAQELVEGLEARAEALGLAVAAVRDCEPQGYGVSLPPGTAVSGAISLAARHLADQPARLEFLPPRVSAWERLTARYASRRLAGVGAAAGVVVAVVGIAFLVQQIQLWRWQSRWAAISSRVSELEDLQQQIRLYRPWFDESVRSLGILRRITEAFPEDGAVSAKVVEIRDASRVVCSGAARDQAALLRTLDQLRAAKDLSDVQVSQIRGRSPIEFTFNFRWGQGPTGRP
ncbi:MAG TPA: hypothetical protein PKM73_11385 [Verrucomicrobiota bacterium]|nr:hypothetical protein [Verrucomicrobiota bacterium]HNU50548.1 hypothetical protein [Verrucomicrobiota bacterium]